jgi:hypothetical protein
MRLCKHKRDGGERLNFTAFYEALLGAKDVNLGTDSAGRGTGKAYTAVLDLLPGDEFEIKLSRKQIMLFLWSEQKRIDRQLSLR